MQVTEDRHSANEDNSTRGTARPPVPIIVTQVGLNFDNIG
jgi:hypothetical protein